MRRQGLLVMSLVLLLVLSMPVTPVTATSSTPTPSFQKLPIRNTRDPGIPRTPDELVKIDTLLQAFSILNYTISKEGDYDVISIPGFDDYTIPGAPALPRKVYTIILPPNADLKSVKLSIIKDNPIVLPGEYNIKPSPPVATFGPNGTITLSNPGQEVYLKGIVFPETPVRLVQVGQERQVKVVRVEYYPFQYDPKEGKLILHDNVVIMLQWEPTTENLVITDPTSLGVLRDLKEEALNVQSVDNWYFISPEVLPSEAPIGYAIITTNAIVQNSARLSQYVEHLQNQGFNVYVVTEDHYGYAEGQQRAINIRNWLKNNYQALNIRYVLLIGNPDPDDPSDPGDSYGDVPMLMAQVNAPTDYFYADLSGDWDLDGDGYYGEYPDDFGSGGVDLFPEVYVGRIPVYNNDYLALDSILLRLMKAGAAPRGILLPMAMIAYENEDYTGYPATYGQELPLYVGKYAEPRGFKVVAMYEGEGLAPVPSDEAYYAMNVSEENFVSAWNSGEYGIVIWGAHGDPWGAYRKVWTSDDGDNVPEGSEIEWPTLVDVSTVSQLLEMPTFVFQVSCDNGHTEYSDNLQYTLFKSSALAVIGASRFTVGFVGAWNPYGIFEISPDGKSIAYYFLVNLLNGMSVGEALYQSKAKFVPGDAGWARNILEFNLYGDPSRLLGGTGKEIYVDDDLVDFPQADYTRISDALNAALPGDTIVVFPGTYAEDVKVNTGVTLKAAVPGEAVITGDGSTGVAVEISASNVVFDGFIVNNTLSGDSKAIEVHDSLGVLISNVITTGLEIRGSTSVTVANTVISDPDSWNPLVVHDSQDVTITNTNIVSGEWFTAVSVSNSQHVNLTDVNIEQGKGIDLSGWSVEHYSTHIIENVTVNGQKIAYFANMQGLNINDLNVAQLIVANCSDFTINNINVAKFRAIIAYSNNGKIIDSHFSEEIGISNSLNMTIENSIVQWIDLWGSIPEEFITHTIVNVTDSWGVPILQIKDVKGPETITPPDNVKQLIITNVSNVDINMNWHHADSVLIVGSQDITFRNTPKYSPQTIDVKFSNKVTIKDIDHTFSISADNVAEIFIENITADSVFISTDRSASVVNSVITELNIANSDNVIVYNNIIGSIRLYGGSSNVKIYQNRITPQSDSQKGEIALYINRVNFNVVVHSNVIQGFEKGIEIESWSQYIAFFESDEWGFGWMLISNWSETIFIYNNLLNNTVNLVSNDNVVHLDIPKTPGKNIVGGPYLGGNYWASPDGTGFSETCTDANQDGICDIEYQVDEQNIDYLPLAKPVYNGISEYSERVNSVEHVYVVYGANALSADVFAISAYMARSVPPEKFMMRADNQINLSELTEKDVVIAVGGPLVNKVTAAYQDVAHVYMEVGDEITIVTPEGNITWTPPAIWYNVIEGYFIIELFEDNNTGALVVTIYGTDADSTMAGAYYFANVIYPNINDYNDISWIVGSWQDTDSGEPVLILDPADDSGFNPTDTIEVVYMG